MNYISEVLIAVGSGMLGSVIMSIVLDRPVAKPVVKPKSDDKPSMGFASTKK